MRAKDLRKPNRVDAVLQAVAAAVESGAAPAVHRGLVKAAEPAA